MHKSVTLAQAKRVCVGSTWTSPRSQPMDYLAKEEVEAFFRAISHVFDQLLFDLTYRHGLRRSEVAQLRSSDVLDDRIWIRRLKNGESGEYPLHPATQKLLLRYRRSVVPDGEHLFPSPHRRRPGPISPNTVYARFRRYGEAAGISPKKLHVHVLRHSIAVHLMDAGWDVADVQDWLGHKSIQNTMVYARITNKRRKENYARLLDSPNIARTEW